MRYRVLVLTAALAAWAFTPVSAQLSRESLLVSGSWLAECSPIATTPRRRWLASSMIALHGRSGLARPRSESDSADLTIVR